ncbi:hypothetical protein E4U25_003974 [Claviceps purpurea]|nr:hypothetical protein E4U36_002910 [Claviceps purpurea]KAG6236220.1 hypothetical protein E4U25_003974 [Claviceps purpurea]
MSFIAPVHLPTSIRHALRIRFLSPDVEDLVVAKANRLEIWRLTDEGMTCLHTKLIYGTISMLQRLQPKDSALDLLFIGTDRLQYFNVAWNPNTNQLDTVEQPIEDIAEQYMRHSQSQNKCLVDPTGKFMAMHLWEGVLNVFRLPVRKGITTKLIALDQVRLTELWMKASTFLHSRTGHPRIAFLYKTQLEEEEARVAVYRLTTDDRGGDVAKFDPHKERELDQIIADPYASILIPVPVNEEKRYHVRNTEGAKAHLGGLLVVGETLLTYFDSLTYSSVSSTLQDTRIYVAWAEYDGTHYFLADDYGRLDLLTIETTVEATGEIVTGMTVSPLKFHDSAQLTSRASSLVYMGNGRLFLASHHGDSQLLHIDISTHSMSLVKSLSNNAPILDFAIMDMGNRDGDSQSGNAFSSGQTRIVAGCGAYHSGSLRSIRSGVGLEDEGILDGIQDTNGLFTLKSHGASHTDTLIVSSVGDTRVFRFDVHGGIEEVYEFQGMVFGMDTLLAADIPGGFLLQITPQCVVMLDAASGTAVETWNCPDGKVITAASANSNWVLLSIDGSMLVSLDLQNHLAATCREASHDLVTDQADQISCLHAARDCPEVGIIGWWTSGTISLVELATLRPLHGEILRNTEDSASVPRDIALVQLHPSGVSGPTLFVALEDGNLVTFNVSSEGYSLSARKNVTLGSSPARLHILPQKDGTSNVFVTTEHASLIYSAEGRIVYSATTAEDATHVAPFDSQAYPDSIVLSTDNHVRLCHVDKERLTHVKSLTMGETVRRVAYSPSLKAFGLGCIKKHLIGNTELITSSFRLVDEVLFQELGEPLDIEGYPELELVEAVIRAELPDSMGNWAERFIVGTSFLIDEETADESDTRGRILVLGVDKDRQVYEIFAHELKGSCRCLAVMGEHIVAGLSKTVVVYNYLEETTASGSLQKVAAYRPGSIPVDLDISGNTIGVIDLMQSLSLLEFFPSKDGSKARLEEKARHFQQGWATSVCHLDGERWLEADGQGNIIVLERNEDAPTEYDRRKLSVVSAMNIGEQINRMRRLHVPSSENAVLSPKAFLGSVEGTLYLYGEVAPQYQDVLLDLQTRLQGYIHAPGNISFELWRAYKSESRDAEGPLRFIDGEMIERFLDMDEGKQELVCEGLGPSVEDIRNMVEELRRMH